MSSKNPLESDEGVSNTSMAGVEYEVFLSFRGPDTRSGFTSHLYLSLTEKGIRVFKDDEELRIGEEIGPELLKGINESGIAIPIFSKDYAASKWCLKELAQIMKCKRTTVLKVMPIFYYVTPTEVRNQTGNYGDAFKSHEKCFDKATIADWKRDLKEVGYLKGWEIQSGTNRNEGELVKEVTKIVSRELKKAHLVVTKCLVGLDQHVEEVSKMLSIETDGVRIVGIYGMGGIGKTTLGKVIYNNLLSYFENHCFLADIRETARSKGKECPQKKLISDILNGAPVDISHVDEGIKIISERFSRKKVLLFMDDVDDITQLQVLMGERDWFGSGSRIIITTRNKHILDRMDVDQSYDLSGLNFDQALQLFSQHAFRRDKPLNDYAILSQKIVEKAGGLPLALEVFGSLLYGKNKDIWHRTLKKLEMVPQREINTKLMISYEALDDRQKQIFLDITCFFIGKDKRIVVYFWDESEISEDAIEVLQEMSLIKIQDDHSIRMHDLLRDLGREIVRLEHVNPEKRSRLCNGKEAIDFFVKKKGGDNVRGIILNFYEEKKYSFSNKNFVSLPNLKLLWVDSDPFQYQCPWYKRIMANKFFRKDPLVLSPLRWLSWHVSPHMLNVSNFSLENLVILDLSFSDIKSNWSGWRRVKMAKNLKVLNLTGCGRLVRTPNFASHPKLEQLILELCLHLEEIDESISKLEHLVVLNLKDCERLRKLPQELSCTESLEELIITGTRIGEIPNWPLCRRLRVFEFNYSRYLKTVGSLDFAANLTELRMVNLTAVAGSFRNMVNLRKLSLNYCRFINMFLESITDLESLIDLDLKDHGIRSIPKLPPGLEGLTISYCQSLGSLMDLPSGLTSLAIKYCSSLTVLDLSYLRKLSSLKISRTPIRKVKDICSCESLKDLYMEDVNFSEIDWLEMLKNVTTLQIRYCEKLLRIPDLSSLKKLRTLTVWSCPKLIEIRGRSESLSDIHIKDCASLVRIPDIPNPEGRFRIENCRKLDESLLQTLGSSAFKPL